MQTWKVAHHFCASLGDNTALAKVKSQDQQKLIEGHLSQWRALKIWRVWIGGQDVLSEGKLI